MAIDRWERLHSVDWDFADYISTLYPADLNSIHWYPAAFVPQIPSALIQVLSAPEEIILDPFTGSGITLVEAARLRRKFIGVDINPYAVNIAKSKFLALDHINEAWVAEETSLVQALRPLDTLQYYCRACGVDDELAKWFHKDTLAQILAIHKYVQENATSECSLLRRVLLSSILNRCSSQRDHYTYITDRCFPKKMVVRNAFEAYIGQVKLLGQAVRDFRKQYMAAHGVEWAHSSNFVTIGDARSLDWIAAASVDLVVTSPPYLAVNDYVRSMRLTYLLMPEPTTEKAIADEIGARRKRHRRTALEEYQTEMKSALDEMVRVLKPKGYLCLILGQGKGKVAQDKMLTPAFIQRLARKHRFVKRFEVSRKIKFRRIQTIGVPHESIIVLGRD